MEHLRIDPAAASSQPSLRRDLAALEQSDGADNSLPAKVFSAYRIDQFADPDGFKTQLGAVLEQYPDEVMYLRLRSADGHPAALQMAADDQRSDRRR
jgi:hypothetical protein